MDLTAVGSARPLVGEVRVPGDKSISHRALILAALADGPSRITGAATGADVGSTRTCLASLGVAIAGDTVRPPRGGLRPPTGPLDAGNSGTTLRLLAGVLAGQPFGATLTGDASLRGRPMGRVASPLRLMGADVRSASWSPVSGPALQTGHAGDNEVAPLTIRGPLPPGPLTARSHLLPMASAQVKSCLLLAGLHAAGRTTVTEPFQSRDHTERLLGLFGARVAERAAASASTTWVESPGRPDLQAVEFAVPGDFSSAAFWIVAGLLVPGSLVRLQAVGVNPTRTGLLKVLQRMGARTEVVLEKAAGASEVEPAADIVVRSLEPATISPVGATGGLRAVTVSAAELPSLIDEIPILALAATQAEGVTSIQGAGELRLKETDRLAALAVELGRMGAKIETGPDSLTIAGPTPLHPARVFAHGDHRMAMALTVAGLVARSDGRRVTEVAGFEAVKVSYPSFRADLERLVS